MGLRGNELTARNLPERIKQRRVEKERMKNRQGDRLMTTEGQRRAIAKYQAKFDDIKVRVPKGFRKKYKAFAESQGKSLNALIVELLEEKMSRD